jgi:hypothetical protein
VTANEALKQIKSLGAADAFACGIDEVLSSMGRYCLFSADVNAILAAAEACEETGAGWLVRGATEFGDAVEITVWLGAMPYVVAIGPTD